MGKNQSASNLTNIIKQDASGNITFVSGSTTLMSVSSSGAITTTGNVAGTASYASNAELLDGLDSTVFTLTSSFAAQTASFTAFTSSVNTFTASQNITNGTFTLTSSFAAQTASFTAFTASQNILNGTYATTGSNTFAGIQTINSNLVVTGSITAQTLVVQTVTSSVSFITGSTKFGVLAANTHQFTGSVGVEGTGIFYQPLTNSTSYLTVKNNRARNAAVYTETTNGGFYAGTSIGTDTFNYQIYDGVAGSARLTISSTGAATFSSSVQATSISIGAVPSATTTLLLSFTSAVTDAIKMVNTATSGGTWYIGDGSGIGNSAGTLAIANSSGTAVLKIASTGAATFSASSSVALTANGGNASDGTVAKFARGGSEKNFYISCTNNQFINLATEGDFRFRVGCTVDQPYATGTTALFVSSSGNVGIGTSTPTTSLTVRPVNGSTNALSILDPVGTAQRIAQISFGNATNDGEITLDSNGTNNVRISSNRLSYFNGGNVGIGTSSPSEKLHLYNSTAATATSLVIENSVNNYNCQINFKSIYGGSTAKSFLIGSNISVAAGSWEIYDATASAARLIIISSGNVGINVTPDSNVKLAITGIDSTSSNFALYVRNSAATTFAVRNDGYLTTGTASASPYNYGTGTAANCVIDTDGALRKSTSSLKYKNDVRNYDKGLTEVLQMRPVYYKGKNDGDTQFAGLIAEEIHELGLTEFVQYAEDRSPDALAYSNMIALAFKAIQELNTKLDAANVEIEALKAR